MLVNYWDKYTAMHDQQNVKKKKNEFCYIWMKQMLQKLIISYRLDIFPFLLSQNFVSVRPNTVAVSNM